MDVCTVVLDDDPKRSEPRDRWDIAVPRVTEVAVATPAVHAGPWPKFDRAWITTVLTAQVAAGAALGIASQAILVWVIIGYVMPFFGLELLDMARDVAAFNLPARVGQLIGVSL